MGVGRYNNERGGWTIFYEPCSLESPLPHWLRGWRGDGILARITTRQQAAVFEATGMPVIDLRGALAETPFLAILGDNRPTAQLAFAHLRERGLVHFAYCGLSPGQHWHQSQRGEAFRRLVEEAGFSCAIYWSGAFIAISDARQKRSCCACRSSKPSGCCATPI